MIKTKQQHNQQNIMMISKMNMAQRALSDLIGRGITVLSVEMARQKPRIEIQTPRIGLVSESTIIRGTRNGIRENTNFSTVSGCIVYWKQ